MSIVLDALKVAVNRIEARLAALEPRRCEECDTVIDGRSDQRFCSGRCRQRAFARRPRTTRAVPKYAAAGETGNDDQDDPDCDPAGGYLDTDWLRVKPGDHA